MTRDEQTGVWSVTLPLRNHLYSYRINVNGTLVTDPSNPPWHPTGLRSQLFVPGSNSPRDSERALLVAVAEQPGAAWPADTAPDLDPELDGAVRRREPPRGRLYATRL